MLPFEHKGSSKNLSKNHIFHENAGIRIFEKSFTRDGEIVKALLNNQIEQSKDPFVKVTRRMLFMSITFTMCYLMVYYAHNLDITYNVIVPKGESARWGFFSWILGAKEWEMVQMTGGLLLSSFMDLCFMVVGFYAIPSKRR